MEQSPVSAPVSRRQERAALAGSPWTAAVAVAVALVAAAVLRFAVLAQQPGLYGDEAAEAWDAHRLLTVAGLHPVWFESDGGREALYAYLVAGAFRLFGESVPVLRGVSALLGVLGVAATGWALRHYGRPAAVAGLAWTAGTLWLVCVARDGERNVLVPLFAALALSALVSWARRPGRLNAVAAGAAVGAGLWTYQPLKLTPLLVLLWLAWLRHSNPERYRPLKAGAAWFVVAYLIVAAPLLWTAASDPLNYFGRAAATSPLNPDHGFTGYPLHLLRTLGMFVVTGDPNPRHNVDGLPLLSLPLFALAALGARRAWVRRVSSAHSLLLLGTVVFLLPPLIATEGGSPHFLRSLGMAPFLAGLIGIGCVELHEQAGRLAHDSRMPQRLAVVAVVALMALTIVASGSAYFGRSAASLYGPFSGDLVQLASAARQPGEIGVIADSYREVNVRFLDIGAEPVILRPGVLVPDPRRFTEVLGLSREDLAGVVGSEIASRAAPVARKPDGEPSVWAVAP